VIDRHRVTALWNAGQRGFPPQYPLVQFPNAPLLIALAASLVGMFVHGTAHDYAQGVTLAGLAAWAWEELAGGVNLFRRVLGLAGFVYVAIRIADAFGG
jgi:hypothetical protein